MLSFFETREKRRAARKQRLSVRREIGPVNLAEAESEIRQAWMDCNGDELAAKARIRHWAERRYPAPESIALVISLVQLGWLIYQVLKELGYLTPTDEQFQSVFFED